ncbi:MarR family winged helix-turn-helix transcriptional regulator [Pseudonocardia sp. ICBG1293]|uniref:MarR family winged helix-turn-helix transcriptional regulator n=1 Tax=Pseudonocardia sp. ICBG1293 TaxID=2844382 RepID=UPI001CCDED79|nr:MarR family transcriptional regulator [Pseudonocardia sp. ICBG1293]
MTDIDRTAEKLAEVYLLVGPLYRRVLREVEETAPENRVSAGVRAVLDQLRRHGPMTVPEIGRSQSLSRQFVQRMVDEALAAGLVERTDNPRHRRSKLVAATAAGLAVIEDVVGREHTRLRTVAAHLPATDVDATLRVLAALVADLAEIEPAGEH